MALDDSHRPGIPERAPEPEHPHGWPELFGKLVLDFTRILEAEARLLRASIQPSLISVLDHWLLQLVFAGIGLVGGMLLMCAAILLLHTWLAWWLCCAIVGAVTVSVALCGISFR